MDGTEPARAMGEGGILPSLSVGDCEGGRELAPIVWEFPMPPREGEGSHSGEGEGGRSREGEGGECLGREATQSRAAARWEIEGCGKIQGEG